MKHWEFSKEYKYFLFPAFLLIVTVYAIPPYDSPRQYIFPFLCVWFWYKFLATPYRVTISEYNEIIFKSIMAEVVLFPEDVVEFKDDILSLTVVHSDGKIKLSSLMNDVYDIKRCIQSINSDTETIDISERRFSRLEKWNPYILFFLYILLFIFLIFWRYYSITNQQTLL